MLLRSNASKDETMPQLAYCDHNFVITAHDAPEQYKTHLRELASSGKVKFVLSPWHWREMARDADHERGESVADFCDSLGPAWLYERRTIQKKEVAAALYKFARIQAEAPVLIGDISEIIYDLVGTRAYRNCRSFVEHLWNIGPNHPMETTFKSAFEANQKNMEDFFAGKFPPQFLTKVEGLYIEGLLPTATPAGIAIDAGTKRAFLSSYKLTDLPATALESKITHENWTLRRQLNQNNFLDQLHVMALPYVDLLITNDDKLSRLMKRAVAGMPFRVAEVLTKNEFDARFPLIVSAATTVSAEEQIRFRAYMLYVQQGIRACGSQRSITTRGYDRGRLNLRPMLRAPGREIRYSIRKSQVQKRYSFRREPLTR
jgi:hypothetical protein